MTTFNLPDLGEGLAEAEIVRWHVNVGDKVDVDQPMLAVETAKAVVEVPAPFSGVVKKLHGGPGDIVATGAPLIEFEAQAGTRDTPTGARGSASKDSGTVVGNMPTSDVELVETAHAGGYSTRARGTNGNAAHSIQTDGSSQSSQRLRAAPAARALAKKLGIDLTQLTGTGRGGVIIVDDVVALTNTTQARIATQPAVHGGALKDGERLRGLRRAMAQSMSLARDTVANCSIFDDADLHNWKPGQDLTTRLLRAIAAACQAEPALNAWFDGASQTRRLMSQVNIGMAVDTADGLIVPVIRDVGSRSAQELRQDIDRLKQTARDRSVTPADLQDVTIMLSNFGMIAGRYATPVVLPPSVAILGAGRLTRDVVAVNERIEAHLRMPLSLTFDHRCVTGGEAARFLAALLRDLEKDN